MTFLRNCVCPSWLSEQKIFYFSYFLRQNSGYNPSHYEIDEDEESEEEEDEDEEEEESEEDEESIAVR